MHAFSELIIGDIFVAPFVGYAVTALVIILALRPILRLCRFDKLFSIRPSRSSASTWPSSAS
jgi:hypothetical protein